MRSRRGCRSSWAPTCPPRRSSTARRRPCERWSSWQRRACQRWPSCARPRRRRPLDGSRRRGRHADPGRRLTWWSWTPTRSRRLGVADAARRGPGRSSRARRPRLAGRGGAEHDRRPDPSPRSPTPRVRGRTGSRVDRCAACGPGTTEVTLSSRVTIPPGQHFCLYALSAVLPLIPAKQRVADPGRLAGTRHRGRVPRPRGADDHAHRADRDCPHRDRGPHVSVPSSPLRCSRTRPWPVPGPGRTRRGPGFDGLSVYADLGFQPPVGALLTAASVTRRLRLGPPPQPVPAAPRGSRGPARRARRGQWRARLPGPGPGILAGACRRRADPGAPPSKTPSRWFGC